ncbi:SH2 domain-containing adapter protein F-like [Lineus longissimus]|uniref:SH2 domain-containing adapter protein F-like n=1 Tax=Lineus longissimus TaxID=88925 RepID=UPI00315C85A6
MAKLLKKTFGLGAKKAPPQPPKPDYNVAGGAVGGVIEDNDAFNRDGEQETNSGSPTSSPRNAQVQSSSPTPQNRMALAAAGLPVLSPRSSSIGGHGPGATGFSEGRSRAPSSSADGKPVLEDYSEPFDARRNGIPLTPKSPNNDEYTEPYDAQQMLKELNLESLDMGIQLPELEQGAEDSDSRLYDDPLDCDLEDVQGFEEVPGYPADDRPLEDYEDPWEWSMKNRLMTQLQDMAKSESGQFSPPPTATSTSPLSLSGTGVSGEDGNTTTTSALPGLRPIPRSVSATGYPGKGTHVEIDVGSYIRKDKSSEMLDAIASNLNRDTDIVKTKTKNIPSIPDLSTYDDTAMGNYEEPWDLQAKTQELEDKIRKRLSKPEFRENFEDHKNVERTISAIEKSPRDRNQSGETKTRERSTSSGDVLASKHRDRSGDSKSRDKKHLDKRQHSVDGRIHLNDGMDGAVGGQENYEEPWDLNKSTNIFAQIAGATSGLTRQPDKRDLPSQSSPQPAMSSPPLHHSSLPPPPNHAPPPPPGSVEDGVGSSPPTQAHNKKRDKLNLDLTKAVNKLGERIDPSQPLEKQGWYHGAIGRIDAENLLRVHKEGSYLVRNSESSKQDFSLSLKSARGFMHMKIVFKDNAYILGQFSQPYSSIPEMIHHYSIHKLPIKGAEHMSLLHPVMNELL